MDNLDKNKIGESFEQQLPDEQLPEFIWDNLKAKLDEGLVEPHAESAESIKESFENGFEQEALPAFLWTDIVGELDANSTLDSDLLANNKIKSSFEGKYQDAMPEDLWNNVENELEIETVWKRVHKGLNQRTRRRYWQEKGMQFGIVALALLWLKGCGVGEYVNQYNTTPSTMAHQETIETVEANPSHLVENKATSNGLENNTVASNENKAGSLNQEQASWTEALHLKTVSTSNSSQAEEAAQTVVSNNNSPVVTALTVVKKADKTKANTRKKGTSNAEYAATDEQFSNFEFTTLYKSKANSTAQDQNTENTVAIIPSDQTNEKALNQASNSTHNPTRTNNSNPVLNNNTDSGENTASDEIFVRKDYDQTMLATITGLPMMDSAIYTMAAFEIKNVAMKKSNNMRFELGLIGKAGTALLLGNTMDRAMESTSMIKTEIRPAGAIGIQMKGQLTKNDALVFSAYPFSVSSQYFGGYTRGGRFYHKEIKLEYFDFSLGYQRTLFHYNDFGSVPSTMYARVEYGLGYLNKSEAQVNGELVNDATSFKKLNHSIGLAIGTTHQIKRFVVDYGIYGNMGLTSISNGNLNATPVMEQTNLLHVGGYLGLRYIL